MKSTRRWSGLLMVALIGLVLVPVSGTQAALAGRGGRGIDVGISHVSPGAKDVRLREQQARRIVRQELQSAGAAQASLSAVGDQKFWLAADFTTGALYPKLYTLRAVGNNSEVWVASDADDTSTATDFPAGDCRNGTRTEITDDQVNYLIDQFDNNILPKESATFSVAPDRDGSNAALPALLGLPADYYEGDGDDTVVLVDNVRDENFYDTNNQGTLSYVAGFFASVYGTYFDRNAMTIDAFDWLHRTGANPPHEPTTDPCTSAPARPFLYEGVFAHEYQHLLESYEDPGETIWVNEGLSDWAQTLTGYVDTSIPITDLGSDSHVQCFLGYLGVQTDFNPIPRDGGPENSLNLWGDQTDFEWEVLCDYGAAYTMMELLADRFGADFMGAFHRDDLRGFESLEALMQAAGSDRTSSDLIDEWAAMVALDGVLDDGAKLKGDRGERFQVSTLDATINWDTDQTYSSPGAPPNGSDYVRLRGPSGYVSARHLHQMFFRGATELPSLPLEWVVDPNPLDQPGDPAWYAGTGDNLDRAVVQEVTVPSGAPVLSFEADWSLEDGFDYGYVQVSTDGGETYETIPCSDQVTGPLGSAYNGESGPFTPETCDLTPWAGQTVVLAFRMVTDSSVHFDGFWVDDVAIDGTPLSDGSSLDAWSSPTGFNPIDVDGYTVRLIAYRSQDVDALRGRGQGHGGAVAWTTTFRLGPRFQGSLKGSQLRRAIGGNADVVAVIVTYHDPTEQVLQYAPYELYANGVKQPGGGV